ncbi:MULTISPECIES: cold-shock protein [Isoptericola]|uniref:Cold shock domain-containing protein n=1 Tax=Isoptericola haloaureus TaxID=1542902 RepID=A0ABU7Z6Q0_9MICO|nr:cold shock domain-containing protein [Isoptericola sp. AK164]
MRGDVVRYDAVKGYAFVAADELDEDVFLHVNDLDFDKSLLAVGTVVDFTHEMGERGPRALSASLISSPVAEAVQAAMGGGPSREHAAPPSSAPEGHHDGYADVLSAAELRTEVTEKLLAAVGDLTARQVLAVRTAVEQVARRHGWLDA